MNRLLPSNVAPLCVVTVLQSQVPATNLSSHSGTSLAIFGRAAWCHRGSGVMWRVDSRQRATAMVTTISSLLLIVLLLQLVLLPRWV